MPFSRAADRLGPPAPVPRGTIVQVTTTSGEVVNGEFGGIYLPPAAPHCAHSGWRLYVNSASTSRFVLVDQVATLSGPDGVIVRDAWDPAERCSSRSPSLQPSR